MIELQMYSLDKETLHDLYWNQEKTTTEIGLLFDRSSSWAWHKLKDFNIKIRSRSKANKIYDFSKEEMIDLYENKNMTIQEIKEFYKNKYGLESISSSTIRRNMRRNNILPKSKKFNKIYEDKEWLKGEYNKPGATAKSISVKYGFSPTTISNWIKKHNIKQKPKKEIYKIIKEKADSTNLKRYGVKVPAKNEEVALKMKHSFLEKYGVENPSQSEKIKEKKKQTFLKNYGYTTSLLDPGTKDKIRKTNLKKYGVEYTCQAEEVKEKMRKSNIESGHWTAIDGKTLYQWSQDEGTASNTTIIKAHKVGVHPSKTQPWKSFIEIKVRDFLIEQNIDFISNEILPEHKGLKRGHNRPDFLVPSLRLIIECDGDYPHANPVFFVANDVIKFGDGTKLLAHEIWTKDKKRDEEYKKHGYTLLKFWGSEIKGKWKMTKESILSKTKDGVEILEG